MVTSYATWGWVRQNLAKGAIVRGLIFVRDKDSKLDYALEEIADKVQIKRYSASNSSSTNPRPPAGQGLPGLQPPRLGM